MSNMPTLFDLQNHVNMVVISLHRYEHWGAYHLRPLKVVELSWINCMKIWQVVFKL